MVESIVCHQCDTLSILQAGEWQSDEDLTSAGLIYSIIDSLKDKGFERKFGSAHLAELQDAIAAVPASSVSFAVSKMYGKDAEVKKHIIKVVDDARSAAVTSAHKVINSVQKHQCRMTKASGAYTLSMSYI